MQDEKLIGLFSYFKHVIDTLPGEACVKIADLIVEHSVSTVENLVDQYYEKVKVRALHLGELKELFAKNETAGFSECTLPSFEINLIDEWENEGKLNPDQVVVDKFKYYFPTKKGSPSLLNTYIFSTVEQGCLQACCPYTGEILSSTKSFPIFMEEKWNHVVFYRFEGKKVFYVGVAGYPALKACVYLPHENLCVISPAFLHLGYGAERIVETIAEMYKKFLLYSFDVIQYINKPSTGVGVLYGLQTNLGHFFTNEYAGLYRLIKARLSNKISAIVAYKNQKIAIEHLFKDFDKHKIYHCTTENNLFLTCIKEGLFIVYPCASYLEMDAIFNIRAIAKGLCSGKEKNAIEACCATPLVFVNLRKHNKSWTGQVEGIIQIAKKLQTKYPNVGIFIDGFPDCHEDAETIAEALTDEVFVYNGTNLSLMETICWAGRSDCYICVVGSGLILLTCIANKPGVAYSELIHMGQIMPGGYWSGLNSDMIAPLPIESQGILVSPDGNQSISYKNYDFSWEYIYNKLINIL